MHIIISNELTKNIDLILENQNQLKTIFFDWSHTLNDTDKSFCYKLNERFSLFFDDLLNHLKKAKYIISNTEVDSDKEVFIDFLKDYFSKSDELYTIHKDYNEKLDILFSEFKKEVEINADSNPILQLIHTRDQLYMSKFLSCYHQTLYNFLKGEQLISFYIQKGKEKFKL